MYMYSDSIAFETMFLEVKKSVGFKEIPTDFYLCQNYYNKEDFCILDVLLHTNGILIVFWFYMHTHNDLMRYMIESHTLMSGHIIDAFYAVDRADFVLSGEDAGVVYADRPLLIGRGQTISQPSTVVFMLELLQPLQGEKILDVGAGSGWTTALLAHIVGEGGEVYGVEIVPELVTFGQNNLAKYDFENAVITQAHGTYGDKEHAPYDKILVSASGKEIPQELIAQLKVDGVLVMPVGHDIVRYTKTSPTTGETKYFYGFSFVPLIPVR